MFCIVLEAEITRVEERFYHWWWVPERWRDIIDTNMISMYAPPQRLCLSRGDFWIQLFIQLITPDINNGPFARLDPFQHV